MERRFRVGFYLVLTFEALVLLVGSWSVPLVDPDEARFARTSVEMMRDGDWVVPHFEGRPRLVKPPLVHWIQSTLFRVLGAREWVARLHAAVGVLGSVLIVGWVARRRYGEEGALWASAALGTMPLVLVLGRLGTLDAFLMLHVLAAVALDVAEPVDARRSRGLLVGALLGLAFLIKGPVGVALPIVIMLAGRTAARRELLPSWKPVIGAIAGWSLIVLPWGLLFLSRIGEQAAGRTLKTEVLDRMLSGTAHVEPFWYYLPVVLIACFPWSVPLALGAWRAARHWRDPGARTAVYAVAGLLAGVLLLSLSRGKLPTYFLPLTPLAALIAAWEIGCEIAEPRRRLEPGLAAGALALLAVCLTVAGVTGVPDAFARLTVGGAVVFGIAAAVAFREVLAQRPRGVFGSVAVSMALFLLIGVVTLHPELARRRSSFHLVEQVSQLRNERPLVRVEMRLPSLTFYLDRVPEEVAAAELEQRIERDDGALYVFDLADLALLPDTARDRLREVGSSGKFVVLEAPATAAADVPARVDLPQRSE